MRVNSRKDNFHDPDCCDLIFHADTDEEWYQLTALMREYSLRGYETINTVGVPGISRYELMLLDVPSDLAMVLKLKLP
jgi:hypothetical protein